MMTQTCMLGKSKGLNDFKMDPFFKKMWVEALRSGAFRQTHAGHLRAPNGTYCCLGVLAKILGENEAGFCTFSTKAEVGSCFLDPDLVPMGVQRTLADMNDGAENSDSLESDRPQGFRQIADYIEKNL